MLPARLRHFWICKKKPRRPGQTCRSTTERLWFTVVVAGVELRRDGIFSSRLAATALYTTSPSVAYLRIDLRIHHNYKSFRNCCYVSQHYSSHLRLTRQQDVTTSSGVTTDKSTVTGVHRVRAVSDLHPKCSYLLYWSNRHGDQPHSCMPGYTFRLPADAKE
jgi:hypothetical protein|nr:MAG TPA: hypothetical protein [Caudoviricetes sp.]